MKIVCDSCGAKYSIADEKVAGKVFKIRCKKCSAVIVVKGDSQDDGDEATRVYDYSAEAVWHVVVDGEQQGPLAPRQIGELLAEGKIDWEAYVWREGMDGWQPAKDIETLVSAIMSDSEGGASSPQAEPRASQAQLFGGSSDMGADPFAGDDGGLSSVMSQSSSAADSGGADLFARSARSPFAGSVADEEPASGSHGSPRVSESESLTGQRNENSVLFSLSNLQALATGSPNAAPAAKPGMAQGEGSGLIDIRALASATQAVASNQSNGSSRDKVEDLMAVGAGSVAFSAAALAAPVAVEKSDNSKVMMAGMAAAILLLGAAVAYLGLRDSSPAEPSIAQAAGETGALAAAPAGAVAAAAAVPAAPAVPATPAAPAQAANNDDADETPSARAERQAKASTAKRSDSSAKSDKASEKASAPAAPAAPAPAPAAPKQSSVDKSIDDLLDSALNGKPAAKKAAPAPAANLAATPTRDEVIDAMKGVAPRVQACGNGQSGVATAKIVVAGPTGRVTSVEVSGQFAGTPVASCIVKEVGKAKFPKFSNATFSVAYPFKI